MYKKVKTTHLDFLIEYFKTKLQEKSNNKFFISDITEAGKEFNEFYSYSADDVRFSYFEKWVNFNVSDVGWKKSLNAFYQKSYLKKNEKVTLKINKELQINLLKLSKRSNCSIESLVKRFAEEERERLEILDYSRQNASKDCKLVDKNKNKIALLLNKSFNECIQNEINFYDLGNSIVKCYEILLDERVISAKIVKDQLLEGNRVKISKDEYYYYGGSIAKYMTLWFGTYELYFRDSFYHHEDAVSFLGMPGNVEVSERLFILLCNIVAAEKDKYKNTLSKRMSPAKRKKMANDYSYNLVSEFEHIRMGIGDSDDFGILFDYAENKYPMLIRY
jgi:hypothetical protein